MPTFRMRCRWSAGCRFGRGRLDHDGQAGMAAGRAVSGGTSRRVGQLVDDPGTHGAGLADDQRRYECRRSGRLPDGGLPCRSRSSGQHLADALDEARSRTLLVSRTLVTMKHVGVNVAADPLMSAAYMGTSGGFVVISADDPGPHSSQTEQDSRLMAMMAKIPVLDPDSPQQAKEMIGLAFALSEAFEIPVMVRPTTRVCHARQDVAVAPLADIPRQPAFERDPARWAATPKFRYHLHGELEGKLEAIAAYAATAPVQLNVGVSGTRAVVVSGVAAAHTVEIMRELGLWDRLPLYQVRQPYPLHTDFVTRLEKEHDAVLVIDTPAEEIVRRLSRRAVATAQADQVAGVSAVVSR